MKKLIAIFILLLSLGLNANLYSQEYALAAGEYLETYLNSPQEYSTGHYFGKEVSKEQEEKILQSLSLEMKAKLLEIKKLDKNKYQQLLRGFPYGYFSSWSYDGNKPALIAGLEGSDKSYKKEKELEIDVELLALKYKGQDSQSQQKTKTELYSKLSELFEIKESDKEADIKKLEKRLSELKESLKERKQNKEEIVQRRIQELLKDAKYLRWE